MRLGSVNRQASAEVVAALERDAQEWEHYLRLTIYVSAVEETISEAGASEIETARRMAWVRWAREYAHRCNPLRADPPTVRVEPSELEAHDPRWFRTEYPRLRESGVRRPTGGDVTR